MELVANVRQPLTDVQRPDAYRNRKFTIPASRRPAFGRHAETELVSKHDEEDDSTNDGAGEEGADAQAARRGIWAGEFVKPWEWRRETRLHRQKCDCHHTLD